MFLFKTWFFSSISIKQDHITKNMLCLLDMNTLKTHLEISNKQNLCKLLLLWKQTMNNDLNSLKYGHHNISMVFLSNNEHQVQLSKWLDNIKFSYWIKSYVANKTNETCITVTIWTHKTRNTSGLRRLNLGKPTFHQLQQSFHVLSNN